MAAMASQITSLPIVHVTVYSGADQRKYQSSASLAFVRGIHRGPVNSPHKWPVTRKMFPFDDVIMQCLWSLRHIVVIRMDPESGETSMEGSNFMEHAINVAISLRWSLSIIKTIYRRVKIIWYIYNTYIIVYRKFHLHILFVIGVTKRCQNGFWWRQWQKIASIWFTFPLQCM